MSSRARKIDDSILTADEAHQVIGVGKGLTSQQVIESIYDKPFQHIVQQDGIAFEAEIEASRRMIEHPTSFFDHPLQTILGQDSADESLKFLFSCEASEKKQQLLVKFTEFLNGLKGARAIWEQALMIADEIYTNGSKNAWPKDKGLFEGPATRTGTLDFFAQADSERLVFGCRDSFGEMDTRAVIERIRKCMILGVADAIRQGAGGAGIGSYMVFDACLSYYVGVEKGKRSVVCVAMALGLSRRNMAGLSKNIHLLAY